MVTIEKASVFVPNDKHYRQEKGPSPAGIRQKFKTEKDFTEQVTNMGFVYDPDTDCYCRERSGYHDAVNIDIGCKDFVDGKFVERIWMKK